MRERARVHIGLKVLITPIQQSGMLSKQTALIVSSCTGQLQIARTVISARGHPTVNSRIISGNNGHTDRYSSYYNCDWLPVLNVLGCVSEFDDFKSRDFEACN